MNVIFGAAHSKYLDPVFTRNSRQISPERLLGDGLNPRSALLGPEDLLDVLPAF